MFVSYSNFRLKSFRQASICSLLFFVSCIALACDKERSTPIPAVFVDFTVDLNGPGNSNLVGIQGYLIQPNEGVKGVIVYHRGSDDYIAFDRACPYRTNDACARISIDNSNRSIAIDSCCQSKFLISNGAPVQGPATAPLRYYFVTLSGSILHITNN